MKNLTRVLVLALVFSMVLGSVAFAGSFTDVKDDAASAEAIQTLADLGILKGYEDGTFGPDKVITRAEAVAVINRMQGLEQAAKGAAGATAYTDVKADHWATGDINLATQMGVIAGDGDGLFRPEDQVKYEEIVKMVVSALGYGPSVDDKGGWPTGYLVIAAERDITKGLSNSAGDPASREIVARVVFNALDAPMMEQVGFGKDATYQVMDGKGGTAKKIILTEKLKVYKLKGFVTANDITSIDQSNSPFSSTDDKKVRFKVTDNYGIDNFYVDGSIVNNTVVNGVYDFLTGESTADQNLGYSSILYVKENDDDDYVVLSNSLEKGRNTTAKIEDTTKIQATDATKNPSVIGVSSGMYLSWYDADVSSTPTEYDLSNNAKIIYNGKYWGYANASNITTEQYAPKQGMMTLLDNDRDDKYDYIFVSSYTTYVVDEVNPNGTRISVKFGNPSIDLNKDDNKDLKYTITMDGKEIDVKDLQEWDVISVAKDSSSDYKYVEIVGARNMISSSLDSVDDSYDNQWDWKYEIDGKAYEASNVPTLNETKLSTIESGDEANFYIDAFGKIAYAEITSTSSKNYGFIVNAGTNEQGLEISQQIRLMGTNGEQKEYTLKDKVRVTVNRQSGDSIAVTSKSLDAEDVMGTKTSDMIIADNIKIPSLAKLLEGTSNGIIKGENTPSNVENYANRIVTYSASNGEIGNLTFFAGETNLNEGNYFTNNGVITGTKDNEGNQIVTYNERNSTFGNNAGVTKDTVVFYLPMGSNASKDDFEIRNISSLKDGGDYSNVYAYSIDSENNAGAVLITQRLAKASQSSSIAVLDKVTKTNNDDGENVKNITFIKDGKVETLMTTSEVANDIDSESPSLKRGDLFEYSVDAKGYIDMLETAVESNLETGVGMVINPEELANLPEYFNANNGAPDAQYVFGVVYSRSGSQIQIGNVKTGMSARHTISDNANFYIVDLNKSASTASRVQYENVALSNIEKTVYVKDSDDKQIEKDSDFCVFLKYYKGDVQDVVIYKGFLENIMKVPVRN